MADSPLRMPPHLIERAKALAGDPSQVWEPPVVRHAATVVLAANLPDGVHLYLQRRVRSMAFAAGMYVFPGGAVEPEDEGEAARLTLTSAAVSADSQAPGVDTVAARVAAVRETAEEAAIALGDPMALTYVGHWVTPEVEDKRFDTRFYATVVDTEAVYESSGETDAQQWVRPANALEQYAAGDMLMLPPTVAVLSDFAHLIESGCDAQAAIAALGKRAIVPLMPRPLYDSVSDELTWQLVDYRTGESVMQMPGAPAGSEVHGANTTERP